MCLTLCYARFFSLQVRDELEQLLDDDEDMDEMYLTDKLVQERLQHQQMLIAQHQQQQLHQQQQQQQQQLLQQQQDQTAPAILGLGFADAETAIGLAGAAATGAGARAEAEAAGTGAGAIGTAAWVVTSRPAGSLLPAEHIPSNMVELDVGQERLPASWQNQSSEADDVLSQLSAPISDLAYLATGRKGSAAEVAARYSFLLSSAAGQEGAEPW